MATSLVFQQLSLMDRKRCCGWEMLVYASLIFYFYSYHFKEVIVVVTDFSYSCGAQIVLYDVILLFLVL